MIHAERQTLDLEQEERVETIVVGVRYTGPKSVAPVQSLRDSGGWPGRSSFQGGAVKERDDDGNVTEREPGPMQVGVVPDTIDEATVEGGTLPGLENLPDFAVIYDPAEIAAELLESNYLPPVVFGGPTTQPDYAVREPVLDALDVPDRLGTAPQNEKALREALAETAGIDTEVEEPTDPKREREYKSDYSRSDLYSACQALDLDVEWKDARKSDMAALLADESAADVREVLEAND